MTHKFFLKLFSVISISLYFSGVRAQADSSANNSNPSTNLVIGVDGLNRAIYAGRNYGIDQYGLNPSVALNFKSGLSLSVYAYGMSSNAGLITETDFQIAYTRKFLKVFSVTPGYAYIINRGDSTSVLNNVLNLSLGLDLGNFSINSFTGFSFGGGTTAWYDEFSLAEAISLLYTEKNSFSITPTFVAILGTKGALATLGHGQNMYKTQVTKAVGKKHGKGNGGSSTGTSTIADISSQFKALCYEFQLPVTYTHNHLSISIIPHYDIPVNVDKPVESTLSGNPFYFMGKIAYTLRLSK